MTWPPLTWRDLSSADHRAAFAPWHGVEHRLEHVATKDGVRYVNDSKATNVNCAYIALDTEDAPIIWIMGGTDKGNDYTPLFSLVEAKVRVVVDLSRNSKLVPPTFHHDGRPVLQVSSMPEAVATARANAEPGDTVLLSPACASFDRFANYAERGHLFRAAVEAI